jgi:hypothetical protein
MKRQATSYTFNALAKTITFSGFIPASLESILFVDNRTTGTLMLAPAGGALLTGTYVSPVLTLAVPTGGMLNTDDLLIFVDDGSATVAISATSLPISVGAATSSLQGIGNSTLNSINVKIPAPVNGLVPVDVLSIPGQPRSVVAVSTSTNLALTTTCRRISITARDANIRFSVGVGAQSASATSHYIWQGERLDFSVPATANIAAIRAGTLDGTLEISEYL